MQKEAMENSFHLSIMNSWNTGGLACGGGGPKTGGKIPSNDSL